MSKEGYLILKNVESYILHIEVSLDPTNKVRQYDCNAETTVMGRIQAGVITQTDFELNCSAAAQG